MNEEKLTLPLTNRIHGSIPSDCQWHHQCKKGRDALYQLQTSSKVWGFFSCNQYLINICFYYSSRQAMIESRYGRFFSLVPVGKKSRNRKDSVFFFVKSVQCMRKFVSEPTWLVRPCFSIKKKNHIDVEILYTQYFGWPYQPSPGVQMDADRYM